MFEIKLETERLILRSTYKKLMDMFLAKGSNYYDWINDPEINEFNSRGLFPQSDKEMDIFFDRCENDKSLLSFMIIEKEKGRHVGQISLQRIDNFNRSAEFAIVIGEKICWGKGYAYEAALRLFKHGFEKLGLNRIWSGTNEYNIGMIKVFDKLGMFREGTYSEAQYLKGRYTNIYCYAMLAKNWFKK